MNRQTLDLENRVQRLEDLANLREGWSDGAGEEITKEAVSASRLLLTQMPSVLLAKTSIFPTEDGGIQFEISISEQRFYTVEVSPSGNTYSLGELNLASLSYVETTFNSSEQSITALIETLTY